MDEAKRASGGLVQLWRDVRAELKKVIWPSGRQTVSYTGFVVVTVVVTAIITVILDAIFNSGLSLIR
jgi:preprotein translocase subunit SecE